jgi:WD40 repeat protein/serine/threonine protein kinase
VVLDLYEVVDVVRTGGMGLVYRVHHRSWNVDLAVKVPRRELVESTVGMRSFEAEAESWVGLGSHPHIVTCTYVRRIDGLPRIFAEWIDGGSLAEAVRDRRIYRDGPPAALRRVLDIAIQFAWGLEHAHQNGLVHQDVKPGNVMLTGDGTVKVTDFGLAKARAAAGERGGAPPGGSLLVSFGGLTPAYCSPEQADAAAGRPVHLTRATDVWSWAVSVLELFTGGPPTMLGQAAGYALEAYLEAGPPEPYLPAMPDPLAALLRRCLAAEPSARPAQMADISDELIRISVHQVGEPYSRPQPTGATLLADGLSNQALSLLDLGHPERADQLWEQALRADPLHRHAVYNHGLRRWRAGRVTDVELIAELGEVQASHHHEWVDAYLLALVHLERGDTDRARELLAGAGTPSPERTAALAAAERPSQVPPPLVLTEGGHAVGAVTLSADGRVAASGEAGGTVRVWDPGTGACLRTLSGLSATVSAVALDPGGRRVAAGDEEGAVQVWDAATGRPLCQLVGHRAKVDAVALSPDGRLVVTASQDAAVMVWESETGRLVRTLAEPLRRVEADGAVRVDSGHVVRWEPNTQRLRMWELATGYLLRSVQLTGFRTVLSVDGRVALACGEREVQVWATGTGRRLGTAACQARWDIPVAVSGDGRWALTTGSAGVQLRELDTGRCLRTLPGDGGAVSAVAVSADGERGLAGTSDGTIRAWRLLRPGARSPWSYARPRAAVEMSQEADLVAVAVARSATLAEQQRWEAAAAELRAARRMPGYQRNRELVDRWAQIGRHGRRVTLLAAWQRFELPHEDDSHRRPQLSTDGRLALSVHRSMHTVAVWDLATGDRRHEVAGHYAAAVSPDGRLVVTGSVGVIGSADRKVRVWDTRTGDLRHTLSGHGDEVMAVAVSDDGRMALSGGHDGTVRVWDLASGRQVRKLGPVSLHIVAIAVSPDNRTVLGGDPRGTVAVWDLAARTPPRFLGGSAGRRTPIALRWDGRTALLLGPGNAVFVWDLMTGDGRAILIGHTDRVTSLAMSPDGTAGYSASADGTLRVWDLASGACLQVLTGHAGAVNDLALGTDGRFALTGGADRTVRVWDLASGACLQVLSGHTGEVESVAWSANSRTALTCGRDGAQNYWEDSTMRVWELDWDYDFPASVDWDEGARPYLAAYAARARSGRPEEFQRLLETLCDAGYGWLNPDGVRSQLAAVVERRAPARRLRRLRRS